MLPPHNEVMAAAMPTRECIADGDNHDQAEDASAQRVPRHAAPGAEPSRHQDEKWNQRYEGSAENER